ncbi:MAG: HEPN domain-containing protein [Nitrospiraceae bacterium]|nr:HEPN domain-containing protein [Nitrospiraceae bacterium]
MRKETEEWVKIADEDLQSAEYLFEKSLYRMACYHAQQTVEKLLKAVLVELEIEIPRVHNLLDLNNAAKKLGYSAPLTDEDTVFLNSIYRSRYPLDTGLLPWGEPQEKDAVRALEIARNMAAWFKGLK